MKSVKSVPEREEQMHGTVVKHYKRGKETLHYREEEKACERE